MSDLEKIQTFIEGDYDAEGEWLEGYDGGWSEFSWAGRDGVEIPGLGLAKIVENFGGEGQGDDRWVVFEVNGRLYEKDGYYASYDGTTWDGDLYEVKPVEVTVTKYHRV